MQLVKTERDNLLRPLQTVSGIVERRHTLPILANLLITKSDSNVSFLSTDLELQITTRADFGVGGESVATTVAARKLLDILRAMPEGQVSLTLTEAGRDAAARIAEIAPEILNQHLSGFTPAEFASLCRLLGKLLDG